MIGFKHALIFPMLMLQLGYVFPVRFNTNLCKEDNFSCEDPSSYRCGCTWQHLGVEDLDLLEDKCIPLRWTCDGHSDCLDGSDERECFCSQSSYKCGCSLSNPNCSEGRGCVPFSSVCDGSSSRAKDCHDKSDENVCRCSIGEYKCGCPYKRSDCFNGNNVSGCVKAKGVCDGCFDCPDNSDEANCTCKEGEYQCGCSHKEQFCASGHNCITHTKVCDGKKDCKDGSDEIGCLGCSKDEFCCDKDCQTCIPKDNVCDGSTDCPKGSDEEECCAETKFFCSDRTKKHLDRKIISSHLQCDGVNNCENWSDEFHCEYKDMEKCSCHQNSTINCTGGLDDNVVYSAIQADWMCDGLPDCPDGSDELCQCASDQFRCVASGICLDISLVCNGINNCEDWSDEKGCACPNGMFRCDCFGDKITCSSRIGCVNSNTMRCDGINNCGDWSDEISCDCPSKAPFACDCYKGNITCSPNTAGCYSETDIRDGYSDCSDHTDEFGKECSADEVRCGCITTPDCSENERCINLAMINDGKEDCRNGDDELCTLTFQMCERKEYKVFVCPTVEKCTYSPCCDNSTCVCTNTTGNNNIDACEYGSWICTSTIPQAANSFHHLTCGQTLQCSDTQAILSANFCDRNRDADGDEVIAKPGFKCPMSTVFDGCVLPQYNLYDDIAHCADRSDLCFVNGTFRCFHCLDRKLIISPSQVCNGVVDCYDMSDECFCKNQTTCSAILGDILSPDVQCPSSQMPCNETCIEKSEVLCNNVVDCINATDESFCRPFSPSSKRFNLMQCYNKWGPVEARVCDGIPECSNYEDECSDECDEKPHFCSDSCHGVYSMGDRYCDGRIDEAYFHINKSECPKGFDEQNCSERFYCKRGKPINIDKYKVCNGVMDCLDGSDEYIEDKSCPRRVYCENGNFPVSVHFTQVGDGKFDCPSGIDECPTETEDTRFASRQEMIARIEFFSIIWIMAIFAIVGNCCVIVYSAMQLFSSEKLSPLSRCNHMLLLNLGFADFLMGVYLIIIGSKAVQLSGDYCFHDKLWRTSALCNAAGVLAIIASETSVLLLATMTAFRLSSMFHPFKITFSACMKRYVTLTIMCWAISITLAFIPIVPSLSGYFVSALWFPNTVFSTDVVSREEVKDLVRKLRYFKSEENHASLYNCNDLVDCLKIEFPDNPPRGEIGYYSDSPVCLPRLYVNRGEQGWEYSMFLITLNFSLFLFITIGYIVLFKQSKKLLISSKAIVQNRVLQRKIFRLIFTDFICWIPICIMAYIQFSGVELDPMVYVVSAVILLPVNSALNPIVYSPVCEKLWALVFHPARAPKITTKRTSSGTIRNPSNSKKIIKKQPFLQIDNFVTSLCM